jgi:PHD - plant homeodomain finger protein
LAYNKKQFCDFCKQVYFEENDQLVDGKEWIGCDHERCKKWNHVDCEIILNNNLALKEALEKEKEDDTFKYFCLQCTKAKKASGGKGGKQSVAQKRVGAGMINQSEDN